MGACRDGDGVAAEASTLLSTVPSTTDSAEGRAQHTTEHTTEQPRYEHTTLSAAQSAIDPSAPTDLSECRGVAATPTATSTVSPHGKHRRFVSATFGCGRLWL
jgi:hypothetical protein